MGVREGREREKDSQGQREKESWWDWTFQGVHNKGEECK